MKRRDQSDSQIRRMVESDAGSIRFTKAMKAQVRADIERRSSSRRPGTAVDPALLLRRASIALSAAAAALIISGAALILGVDGTSEPAYRVSELPGAAVIYNQER